MAKLEKPLTIDEGWKESNAPDMIKWDNPGETVAGILTSITTIVLNDKKVQQYLLTLGEKQFKFLATFDLAQKLTRRYIGCQVRVKYLGEDENIRGGPNNQPMKVFSVLYRGTPTTENIHGVSVTDEDIPF